METADANDVLYALEASGDYDPAPDLEKIRAPLLAINFADDLINPPELGILEREIAARAEGARRRDPDERQDRRPRHAHDGGGVEAAPRGAAPGDERGVGAAVGERASSHAQIADGRPFVGAEDHADRLRAARSPQTRPPTVPARPAAPQETS